MNDLQSVAGPNLDRRSALPWLASMRRRMTPWLFISPFLVGFLALVIGPVLATLALSFTSYDVFSPPEYVGLDNYRILLGSADFWHTWRITLLYAAGGLVYTIGLAFAFALALFHVNRAGGFWRSLYYLPALLAGTAEALLISVMWNRNGLINAALNTVGIQGPGWLDTTQWALLTLIVARYWTIGNAILLFLGSRSSVPRDLYDSAAVDGAGSWQSFRHISLPMMTPILLYNVLLAIVVGLQSFTQVMILTEGGPFRATRIIGLAIYFTAFRDRDMGLGAAMSWSLFAVTLCVLLLILRSARYWVHYEGDREEGRI